MTTNASDTVGAAYVRLLGDHQAFKQQQAALTLIGKQAKFASVVEAMAPFRDRQAKFASVVEAMAPFRDQQAKFASVVKAIAPFREQHERLVASIINQREFTALQRLQSDAARAIAPLVVNDGSASVLRDPVLDRSIEPAPDVADPVAGFSRRELAQALVIGLFFWDQLRSVESWEDLNRAVLTLPLALAMGLLVVACLRSSGD